MAAAAEPSRRIRVRPLLSLLPYVMRYRAQVIGALIALLIAAAATLAVPLAVRRMIDFGFSAERISLIDQYFAVMIGVAAVLAVASAARYYLVTIIGERVVADLRAAVFAHLTELSPGFFDTAKTGEITSRLTADTTQIKSAVGSSVSVALRNLVLFIGSSVMMVVTSPRLSFFVIIAIPVIVLPLVAFGRLVRARSRTAQDTLADASAYAAELIGAIRTLQAFTSEAVAQSRFAAAVERAFDRRPALDPRAGTPHRDHHLPRVRQRRPGPLGGRTGRARLPDDTRHARPVHPLCGVRRERARAAQRGVGRAIPGLRRRGAPDRAARRPAGHRGAGASRAPAHPGARGGDVRDRALRLSDAARGVRARWGIVPCAAGREGRDRRPLRRRQEHDLPPAAALL